MSAPRPAATSAWLPFAPCTPHACARHTGPVRAPFPAVLRLLGRLRVDAAGRGLRAAGPAASQGSAGVAGPALGPGRAARPSAYG
ncbi:hypothetical protein LUR56_15505 [Streptomyces sp. MT29]|nr:hypothetical protein [Streptomyces sp. MT29]